MHLPAADNATTPELSQLTVRFICVNLWSYSNYKPWLVPRCESVHCCHKHDEFEGKENKVTYSKALKTSGHQLTDDLHFRLHLHLTVWSLPYNTAQLETTAIVIWCYLNKTVFN